MAELEELTINYSAKVHRSSKHKDIPKPVDVISEFDGNASDANREGKATNNLQGSLGKKHGVYCLS